MKSVEEESREHFQRSMGEVDILAWKLRVLNAVRFVVEEVARNRRIEEEARYIASWELRARHAMRFLTEVEARNRRIEEEARREEWIRRERQMLEEENERRIIQESDWRED